MEQEYNYNCQQENRQPGRAGRTATTKYTIKQISINWYGIYDQIHREPVMESTYYGMKVYAKLFGIEFDRT